MESVEGLKVTGKLQIRLNGEVVREVDNLVVSAGKEWIASRMQGVADGVVSHMAIGTGTTAAAAGDTALEIEVARVALNTSGGVVSTNTITFETTFPADTPNVTAPATAAITEAGVLNAGLGGTLIARTVFSVVNKGEADTMTITWTITIS